MDYKFHSDKEKQEIRSNIHELQTQNFSINASAKAFKILSSNIYTNKIRAIIRELSTNAVDAHIDAGTVDKKFDVTLPTIIDPVFTIRDYGTGLSESDITSLYTTYFGSTKSNNNNVIGEMGLGSKSPLSYTTTFTVTSFYDGLRSVYTVLMDGDVPTITKLYSEPSNEHPGLLIEVPAASNDIADWNTEAQYVYSTFKGVMPNPVNFELGDPIDTFEGYNFGLIDGKVLNPNQTYLGIWFIMGNILYPLDGVIHSRHNKDLTWPVNISDFSSKPSYSTVIRVPIGTLDVDPGREGLSYDKLTLENIDKAIRQTLGEINQYIDNEIGKLKTRREIYNFYSGNGFDYTFLTKRTVKYNKDGVEVEQLLSDLVAEANYSKYKELSGNTRGELLMPSGRGVINPHFENKDIKSIYSLTPVQRGNCARLTNNIIFPKKAIFILSDTQRHFRTISKIIKAYKNYYLHQNNLTVLPKEFGSIVYMNIATANTKEYIEMAKDLMEDDLVIFEYDESKFNVDDWYNPAKDGDVVTEQTASTGSRKPTLYKGAFDVTTFKLEKTKQTISGLEVESQTTVTRQSQELSQEEFEDLILDESTYVVGHFHRDVIPFSRWDKRETIRGNSSKFGDPDYSVINDFIKNTEGLIPSGIMEIKIVKIATGFVKQFLEAGLEYKCFFESFLKPAYEKTIERIEKMKYKFDFSHLTRMHDVYKAMDNVKELVSKGITPTYSEYNSNFGYDYINGNWVDVLGKNIHIVKNYTSFELMIALLMNYSIPTSEERIELSLWMAEQYLGDQLYDYLSNNLYDVYKDQSLLKNATEDILNYRKSLYATTKDEVYSVEYTNKRLVDTKLLPTHYYRTFVDFSIMGDEIMKESPESSAIKLMVLGYLSLTRSNYQDRDTIVLEKIKESENV